MVRLVQVFVPHGKAEKIRNLLTSEKTKNYVMGLSEITGTSMVMFHYRAAEKHVSIIVERLTNAGVGKDGGSIDISNLQSTLPALDTYRTEKKKETEIQTLRSHDYPRSIRRSGLPSDF